MKSAAYGRYHSKFKKPTPPLRSQTKRLTEEQIKICKPPMYKWADNEIAKKGYTGHTANLLKAIIACADEKGATIATLETLHNRLIKNFGRAAPSRRTVDNSIKTLVEKKSISRTTQYHFKDLVTTRILRSKTKSVVRSTQVLRTEYILPQSNIYIGEADLSSSAASQDTRATSLIFSSTASQAATNSTGLTPVGSAAGLPTQLERPIVNTTNALPQTNALPPQMPYHEEPKEEQSWQDIEMQNFINRQLKQKMQEYELSENEQE